MGKMKILMLNYEFPPLGGGAGNATFYLLREIATLNSIEIDLVTSSVTGYKQEKFSDNITIHYLDIGKNNKNLHYQSNRDLIIYTLKAYYYCKKLLNKEKYTLCHSFFGIPCGFISMLLRLPYIVSLRGSDVPFYNYRFYWYDKLIFKYLSSFIWRKAAKVTVNSAGLKELALITSPRQKFDIIYNGIDNDDFKPCLNKDQSRGDQFKIISVGRLIQRKGYQFLIEAMRGIQGIELTIIGDGVLLKELMDLADNYGLNVIFLGELSHDQIADHLKQADVFVMPSLNEGMSNAILEAMACGLPIITTDVGGSKELINSNGLVVKKESAAELRSAIDLLKNDSTLRSKMGKESTLQAEKFSWKNVALSYLNIYEATSK